MLEADPTISERSDSRTALSCSDTPLPSLYGGLDFN